MSDASKARLRRATVTGFRTFASARRVMASFVCWKLRPTRLAAPATVTIGAPGSARISRSVAESARMRPTRVRQVFSMSTTRASKAPASATELAAVAAAGGNGRDPAQPLDRHGDVAVGCGAVAQLARIVAAPGADRAVAQQGQAVLPTG